ncbi:hypothetical protein C8Q76DRAFT_228836 [Earliella scabrosa]|nr:hypothetical protein C8Q76DRAFT_228836 [Earliella scabrosa]
MHAVLGQGGKRWYWARALRKRAGTTESASPPLSRATGGPSSSQGRSKAESRRLGRLSVRIGPKEGIVGEVAREWRWTNSRVARAKQQGWKWELTRAMWALVGGGNVSKTVPMAEGRRCLRDCARIERESDGGAATSRRLCPRRMRDGGRGHWQVRVRRARRC